MMAKGISRETPPGYCRSDLCDRGWEVDSSHAPYHLSLLVVAIVGSIPIAALVSQEEDSVLATGGVLVKLQVAAARREASNARSLSDSSHRRERDVQRRLAALTNGSNNSPENLESFLS